MSSFNRTTITAATEVLADFKSHAEMDSLYNKWGIPQPCFKESKKARAANLADRVIKEQTDVLHLGRLCTIDRALIEEAILAPHAQKTSKHWKELIAGLKFDGFTVEKVQEEDEDGLPTKETVKLVRMFPSDIPEIGFKEAENEVELLLKRFNFETARGHLKQAFSNFSSGNWASANSGLRSFYESYLNEIANKLGYTGKDESLSRREYLINGAFISKKYNEDHFVTGLMKRLHPEGPHPGLSDEEDATFRLQISLITARLFLRRLDQKLRNDEE